MFKLTLLGDAGVGKTSLRKKFLGDSFKQDYLMTIGADFSVYRMGDYTLHIWDIAGQLRFSKILGGYFRGTLGSLLVFDITRKETFKNLPNWIGNLLQHNGNQVVPFVIVGNKSDLRAQTTEPIDPLDAIQYADTLTEWSKFRVPYIETSALTGLNVEMIFSELVKTINESIHLLT
ncbi:MAG: Rab family GTPase [Candidatus Kariarchaeaceae archaeon]